MHDAGAQRVPIAFAHRGASAHAPENTIEAFGLALEMGATGIESDVWLTSDEVPVLKHFGAVRSGLLLRPISRMRHSELPASIPSLEQLYEECGSAFELSLDVKGFRAGRAAIRVAGSAGSGALGRLWLCNNNHARLAGWRELSSEVRLVDSTRRALVTEGLPGRARALRILGVDALNLHRRDWRPDMVDALHESGLLAFGWDAHRTEAIERLLAMEIDAVYSDHVDRMVEAICPSD